jgi:membrane protease YdiL (CAAX protease family)
MPSERDLVAGDEGVRVAGHCTSHALVDAVGSCATCRQDFCEKCLVDVPGRGSLCIDCAMVAAGIRTKRRVPLPAEVNGDAPAGRPLVDRGERKRIRKTAIRAIWVGIAFQWFALSLQVSGNLETERAIFIGLGITVGFYAVVSMMVMSQLTFSDVRPQWTKGAPLTSVAIGVAAGFALVALVATLVDDPVAGITTLVSEGTVVRIALAFLIFAGCAPVVEELLFRGLVSESMRARGPLIAAASSSALFAAWHLRPPFWYFFVAGVALWGLYWTRGLAASMACHTIFNGTLVVLAVMVVFGPTHVIRANGISLRAPQTWERVEEDAVDDVDLDLAVSGPSGASLEMLDIAAPPGHHDADDLAQILATQQIQLPQLELEPATIHVERLRAGDAVRAKGEFVGHSVDLTLIPKGDRVWIMALLTGGSARARSDYEGILKTLVLPAKPI